MDFETGGLDANNAAITEIAAMSMRGDDTLLEIERYYSLVLPYNDKRAYDPKALAHSNISMEMIADEGKQFKVVVEELIEFFKRANVSGSKSAGARPILVGQNIQFDIGFLQAMFREYCGDKNPKAGDKLLEQYFHGKMSIDGSFFPTYIDTWALGKMWFGGSGDMENFQLKTLVNKVGAEIFDAHRAMNDVVGTAEFLRAAILSMQGGYELSKEGKGIVKGRTEFLFQM